MGGARALGLADEIGSVEPGKRADHGRRSAGEGAHSRPVTGGHPASEIVYACRDEDVTDVVVDGRHVVATAQLLTASLPSIAAGAERERVAVLGRSGLLPHQARGIGSVSSPSRNRQTSRSRSISVTTRTSGKPSARSEAANSRRSTRSIPRQRSDLQLDLDRRLDPRRQRRGRRPGPAAHGSCSGQPGRP